VKDENQPGPKPKLSAVTAPAELQEEQKLDLSLRPRTLADFIGQERLEKIPGMSIRATRGRGDVLDHVLLSGPPGLGKTSLAHIIARELGVNFRQTSGPAIERGGDVAALVVDLQHGDVLFIDEIHRLARPVEEVLYPAMEDFQLNIAPRSITICKCKRSPSSGTPRNNDPVTYRAEP
jgi:Holliday junction DNA helicase RuvB